jgi:membrane fusion protein, multidrug efflux system
MKKGVAFKSVRVIVVLALSLAIAGLLITFRPKSERIERTIPSPVVGVFSAKAQDMSMSIQAYGTVQPREALNLVAEVHGQAVHIPSVFTEGSAIGKGTVLVRIDPRTYSLEVERSGVQIRQIDAELNRLNQEVANLKASISIVSSDVALAESELSRLKKLSRNAVVSQTTLDKAEQGYLASLQRLQSFKNQMALTGPRREQLEAQQAAAQVLLKKAMLDLERTSIIAPFDGWVLEKMVEKGQHVTIGQYLGKIYRDRALDVEVRIPLKDLQWLPDISGDDLQPEAEISIDGSVTEKTWPGKLVRTKAQMDERTRTLPVVIEINEQDVSGSNPKEARLRPGMFVSVKIKGSQAKQVFVLSRHAVHPGDVVYIVAGGRLNIRPVHVLRRFKESVYVDQGLTAGELIVNTPIPAATEGMAVKVRDEDG